MSHPTSSMQRRTLLRAVGAAFLGATAGLPALTSSAHAEDAVAAEKRPLRQLRGMWIASVVNINWPSKTGLTPEVQMAEYLAWLDVAQSRRLNAVFAQIRPTADAFWPSPFEPWSQYLSGVQGQDPGYDPLAFMISAAHERGLAFHGWFNPYRVSMQADPSKLVATHPARVHPDWVVPYAGKLYYNPGLPEVRAFVQDAIMDAVSRYDLDGVHFDDYFYPYPVGTQVFNDDAAFAAHGAGFPDRAAWRRHNIDLLVSEMQGRVRDVKPEVAWGVSPFGIWRNAATDPLGSATGGTQSYDANHADTRGWVRNGLLDYIAPQIYWHIGLPVADYAALAPWWAGVADGTDVQLWIGQAAYKVTTAGQPAAWFQTPELSSHLTLNKAHPQIGGDIWYNANDVRADRIGSISQVVADHYSHPALPPLLPRLAAGPRPHHPVITKAELGDDGVSLCFHATAHQTPRLYAIYRFTCGGEHDFTDGRNLIAVLPGGRDGAWTDPTGTSDVTYHVTALDAANRESTPSPARCPN